MEQPNNKAIVEFMGQRIMDGYVERYIDRSENVRFPNGDLICGWNIIAHESKLTYHTSFDAIIPVVREIKRKLMKGYPDHYNDWVEVIDKKIATLDIKVVYALVIGFIDWYNEQETKAEVKHNN